MNLNLLSFYFACLLLMSCQFQSKKIDIVVENNSNCTVSLNLANPEFRHASQQRIRQITFLDTPHVDSNILGYEGYSHWLKIRFDGIKQPIIFDFLNHHEAIGFDEKYQPLKRISPEMFRGLSMHERHFAFELPLSNEPRTYYFKTYAATIQKSDTLKWVIEPSDIFKNKIHQSFYEDRTIFICYMILVGVAFFQILYIASLAWSRRRTEYWDYLAFSIMGLIYVLSARRYELGLGEATWLVSSSIFAYLTLITFFYSRFVRNYLDTPNLNHQLDKQLRIAEWILLLCVLINLMIYLFTGDMEYTERFHKPLDACVKILNCYFLFLFYRQRSALVFYLLSGVAVMIIPAVFRFIYEWAWSYHWISRQLNFDIISILGSIVDAICLNLGLNYKHRLEVVAQQSALDNERNRIASEMHDDLGAGLSTIRLLSEMAKKDINNPKKLNQIERITVQSNDLIEKMSTIIWAMNSRNDSITSLIAYNRRYAFEYLETVGINCHFEIPNIPPSVSTTILTGEIRRQVFLSFKEALHNIIKHAQATEVNIHVQIENNFLRIVVKDNGKGYASENILGNGLKNMRERMLSIDGTFSIQSEKNKGTTVVLSLKINKS